MYFSVTFRNMDKVSGKALKFLCNGVDFTEATDEERLRCFVDGNNMIHIETETYKIDFQVNKVYGFNI